MVLHQSLKEKADAGLNIKITKDMKISDVIEKYPEAIMIFINHGLGCVGCSSSSHDTIEQGCKIHALDTGQLLEELNDFVKNH